MLDETLVRQFGDAGFASAAGFRAKVRPYAKRMFDFSVALILIIAFFPVACLIASAVLANGQSPFYSHVRLGRGGRNFGCLKFRSMRPDADIALTQFLRDDPAARLEWETNRKLRNDPRVTRIGRMLRATSLDELPQLSNILVGHMSLVGPRPVTRDEFTQFYGAQEAAAYSSVRPGLTGLWQIKGRSEAGFADRVAFDALYAQRLSLRTDLVILFQTVRVVISQRGAW